MDRYYLFRKMLDMVADDFEVVDAEMTNYAGNICITGKDEECTVTFTATIKEEA